MKKILLSLALSAALLSPSAVMAQQQNCQKSGTEQTECKKDKECKKQAGPRGMRQNLENGQTPVKRDFNPFIGIELTDAQAELLNDIKMPCRENARCTAEGERGSKPVNPREAREEYVKKVKQVLTPDQYTTFLENMLLYAPAMQQSPRGHHGEMIKGDKVPVCDKVGKDCKKADCKKDCKKDGKKDCKKADCKKDCKKDGKKDCKKADCKKDGKKDCKKDDCKKDCKK